MKYKCPKCKEIIYEEDLVIEKEREYYEFWGAPCHQDYTYAYCPHCHEEIGDDDEYDEEDEEEEDEE